MHRSSASIGESTDYVDPSLVPCVVLATGSRMRAIGLGTFGSDHVSHSAVAEAVKYAASIGYRHFDCASVYGNEEQIGKAFKDTFQSELRREEVWITSKLWNDKHGENDVIASCEKSLADLQIDYLDLYLIHCPFPNHHPPGCDTPEKTAGYLLTGSLAGFGIGRFASSALMKHVNAGKLMGIFAVINVVLVAIGIAFPGWAGLCAVFLTSFFMSLMFPTIFALGIRGLGPNTESGASLIVMAIIGGAAFPWIVTKVNLLTHSMAMVMIVPLVCYVAVGCYAFWGCKLKPRAASATKPRVEVER